MMRDLTQEIVELPFDGVGPRASGRGARFGVFEEWLEFEMSATELIRGILAGHIKLPNFDEYFTEPPHTCERS